VPYWHQVAMTATAHRVAAAMIELPFAGVRTTTLRAASPPVSNRCVCKRAIQFVSIQLNVSQEAHPVFRAFDWDAMSVWNKVFIGLIVLVSLGLLVLSMMVLRTNENVRKDIAKFESDIIAAEQQYQDLLNGNSQYGKPLREMKADLYAAQVDQGRIWRDVRISEVLPQDAEGNGVELTQAANLVITANVDRPSPHQIAPNMVLHAFEQQAPTDPGVEPPPNDLVGTYMGEFQVVGADNASVTLSPTMRFELHELQRIGRTQGTWSLYEVMPSDRAGLFQGLEREELAELFRYVDPASGEIRTVKDEVLDEYFKDGKQAEPGDPADRLIEGQDGVSLYNRQLRDYSVEFHELHKRLVLKREENRTVGNHLAAIQASIQAIADQNAGRDVEITNFKAEKTEVEAERDLAATHLEAVLDELALIRTAVDATIERNKELATRWAEWQLEQSRRIDERTGPAPVAAR